MKLKLIQLYKIGKSFYKKYKDLINDIIVFGSSMRGKINPNDIDVLIVFNKNINKNIEYEFKKQASKIFNNISIISKTQDAIYDSSFAAREAILFEGYSIIKKEFIASLWGYSSLGIFIYKTNSLNNATKTLFYYALNGRRGSNGVLDSLNGIKLSDNIIAVPLAEIEAAKEFFSHWKIEYTYIPSLIPFRLAKKHIIGKVI